MAPIAPGRRLRQEEPDTGAAGGDARVPVMGAIAKQGSAPPAVRAVARAGRSSVLRLRRNGAHPAPHPSDRSGTAVGLIAPANDEGPLVSTCLPAPLVSRRRRPAWHDQT